MPSDRCECLVATLAGARMSVRAIAHVQTTLNIYGWVREAEALRAAANWKSYASSWQVHDESSAAAANPAEDLEPVQRLWRELPAPWRAQRSDQVSTNEQRLRRTAIGRST